jgi:hypothetical protein
MKKIVLLWSLSLVLGFGHYSFGMKGSKTEYKTTDLIYQGRLSLAGRLAIQDVMEICSIPVSEKFDVPYDGNHYTDRSIFLKYMKEKLKTIKDIKLPSLFMVPSFCPMVQTKINVGQWLDLIDAFFTKKKTDSNLKLLDIGDFFGLVLNDENKIVVASELEQRIKKREEENEKEKGAENPSQPSSSPISQTSDSSTVNEQKKPGWSWTSVIGAVGGWFAGISNYFTQAKDEIKKEEILYCLLKLGLEIDLSTKQALLSVGELRNIVENAHVLLKGQEGNDLPADAAAIFLESAEGADMKIGELLSLLDQFIEDQKENKQVFKAVGINISSKIADTLKLQENFVTKILDTDLKTAKDTTGAEFNVAITKSLREFYLEKNKTEEPSEEPKEEPVDNALSSVTKLLQSLKEKLVILLDKVAHLSN